MTDEQINHAIAEACGFVLRKTMRSFERDKIFFSFWNYPQGWKGQDFSPWLPDFCNDLNVMHEAEKTLNNRLCIYGEFLCEMTVVDMHDHFPECYIWHKTARQRAEAFLRTLGKWEDVK